MRIAKSLGLAVILVSAPLFAGAILDHPAPGTTLVRFAQIDTAVYKGSKPKTPADFDFLQSKHIQYILNIRFLPWLDGKEHRHAEEYGMQYMSGLMNASTFPPAEKHVDHILAILHDPRYQPIYFHCDIGRDRISLVATLYELYFKGLSQQDAWHEMKRFGFKDSWTLVGLKHYLLKHLTEPPALATAVSQTR